MVGPYDVLAGKTKRRADSARPNYLCHWRYYYDPPEFLTVVRGDDKKQFHIGYYRYVVRKILSILVVVLVHCLTVCLARYVAFYRQRAGGESVRPGDWRIWVTWRSQYGPVVTWRSQYGPVVSGQANIAQSAILACIDQ